jgi:MOSC domain-containing protein
MKDGSSMPDCRVVSVYDYPVKGAAGRVRSELHIDPAVGVLDDRRYAFKQVPSTPDEWAPKSAFFVGMNTALMVAQVPALVNDKDGERLDPGWLAEVAKRLGVESLDVLDTHGAFSLADRPRRYVSIINLASVRALGEFVGTAIDPARFRMNVWIDGLEPFAELDWVQEHPATRDVQIGAMHFRVDEACVRCKAIEANPQSGEYDLELQQALEDLMQCRGYPGAPHNKSPRVMGVLARPYSRGVIRPRDTVLPF